MIYKNIILMKNAVQFIKKNGYIVLRNKVTKMAFYHIVVLFINSCVVSLHWRINVTIEGCKHFNKCKVC